ncbi:AraC family transcriptional regulator [Roseibium sediminicola]|uniref:AraC family transcriptional regulator n=1 Tax=Roseibium sediminicola TaxID=2933272 RepID=A0ABT0H199_9HYPH|nr:AraC family transcriptional regulator [Roseibium sp. CAU 1639]MCK7615468.1 AraC family transcriptional regulator [Roseibium sp. CAU 1639]
MKHDALSQILDALKLRGSIYFHTSFSPPWAVEVPAFGRVARFHMAMRGSCWLVVKGREKPVFLATGDLAVIPHGAAHVLCDELGREATSVDRVLEQSGYSGEGALYFGGPEKDQSCKLFCGHFEFEEGTVHPILEALPDIIHVPNTQTLNAHWLEAVMRFVASEVRASLPGSDAIVHRLTEIIFIQVVRTFVDQEGDRAGCLAAVLNPNLGRSMSRIHLAPEKSWTVEALAREAGMSRTVFAERFSGLVGMTPLAYVTHWRMEKARRDLRETDLPLIDIAETIGYSSEAAFNRAFKRQFNLTPGQMRREVRSTAPAG